MAGPLPRREEEPRDEQEYGREEEQGPGGAHEAIVGVRGLGDVVAYIECQKDPSLSMDPDLVAWAEAT
jgi:hypothetical protein